MAEVARKRKPWLWSTGPRSLRGKRIVAGNAYKHGLTSIHVMRFRHLDRMFRSLEQPDQTLLGIVEDARISALRSVVERMPVLTPENTLKVVKFSYVMEKKFISRHPMDEFESMVEKLFQFQDRLKQGA